MEQKDLKDMTASELLRATADSIREGVSSRGVRFSSADSIDEFREMLDVDSEPTYAEDMTSTLSVLADKIDAELSDARAEGIEASLRAGAEIWAKANGWPDFRDGEDFGAWLERCALKRPCYEDGEPVRDSSEWKAIMMSLDGSRFQLLKSYPDGLCFTGSPVKRPDPDTQERIDEDAQKSNQSYWGCEGRSCKVCPAIIDGAKPCERYDVFSCEKAKTLDLLRRQRELDARKGGAE